MDPDLEDVVLVFDNMIVLYAAMGMTFVVSLAGPMKWLRSDKRLGILLWVTAGIAVLGLAIRSDDLRMVNGNAADYLFGPFIYLGSFALLWRAFLKKHGVEPTSYRSSWYDPVDGRRQTWGDVAVHAIPFMLAFGVPPIIGNLFP